MRASAVVYDPERMLPPTFVRDEGLGGYVVVLDDLAGAHRLGRRAKALVIVGGRDESGAMGLLTSAPDSRAHTILLFLADARHQRHVMLRGARRGALVLIGQPPVVLGACLRVLVAPPRAGGEGVTICRATSPTSAGKLWLRLVAARRSIDRHGRRAS